MTDVDAREIPVTQADTAASSSENAATEASNQPKLSAASADWFLQHLVQMANAPEPNMSIPITLHVGGLLVSGMLTSGKNYFIDFGKSFAGGINGISDETSKMVQQNFAKFGDIYNHENVAKRPEGPQFIHLKDAQVFHPNGQPIPTNTGVWWRFRLSDVSGFTLGTLSLGVASPQAE